MKRINSKAKMDIKVQLVVLMLGITLIFTLINALRLDLGKTLLIGALTLYLGLWLVNNTGYEISGIDKEIDTSEDTNEYTGHNEIGIIYKIMWGIVEVLKDILKLIMVIVIIVCLLTGVMLDSSVLNIKLDITTKENTHVSEMKPDTIQLKD